jgi:hypothetical protein
VRFSSRVWLVVAAAGILAAAIVAFVAYGTTKPGTPEQQLRSWVSSTKLGQDIGTLVDDGTHVREAVSQHQSPTSVRTVCAAMANDAQTFNDNLPSPDSRVTQLLAKAYGLEYDAAEACYRSGGTTTALLTQSATDRSEARTLFAQVLARVATVTHSTVPTTTTTVPNTTGTSFL